MYEMAITINFYLSCAQKKYRHIRAKLSHQEVGRVT